MPAAICQYRKCLSIICCLAVAASYRPFHIYLLVLLSLSLLNFSLPAIIRAFSSSSREGNGRQKIGTGKEESLYEETRDPYTIFILVFMLDIYARYLRYRPLNFIITST